MPELLPTSGGGGDDDDDDVEVSDVSFWKLYSRKRIQSIVSNATIVFAIRSPMMTRLNALVCGDILVSTLSHFSLSPTYGAIKI